MGTSAVGIGEKEDLINLNNDITFHQGKYTYIPAGKDADVKVEWKGRRLVQDVSSVASASLKLLSARPALTSK
jgi:hypothetical protein